MATLKFISWNCQGLRLGRPQTFQKMYFLETQYPRHQFDVLALLETHHASEADFPPLLQEYNVNHHIIHTPAPSSDPFSGIVVILNDQFTVLSSDTLLPGRIVTIHFKHHVTEESYLLTVYYGVQAGSTTVAQLNVVFKTLLTDHAAHTNSFLLGDFNFVTNDLDRTNGMNSPDKKTAKQWLPFQTAHLLVDPFRHLYPKRRIYSFQAAVGSKPKSRIDRLYVSAHNVTNITKYLYIPTPFLDHKIQEIHFATRIPTGRTDWKMNVSVLPDTQYQALIHTLIDNMDTLSLPDHGTWWEVFLLAVRSYTITYTKHKAFVKHKLKNAILQQLEDFDALPLDRVTPSLQHKIDHLQEQLRHLQLQEVDGYVIRSRLPRFEDKEPRIEHYAHLEKSRTKSNLIPILLDTYGTECTHQPDLLTITHDYYTRLYTPSTPDSAIQRQLLQKVTTRLTASQKDALDAPLTLSELTQAVTQLPANKTPGRDGIPIEFYQHFWPHIQDHYLQYLNEACSVGFKETRNMGITKLIYKDKGDPKDLANYRPISLLNCDLKILTKTLATRLKSVLPDIIHRTQTAVPGRKIDYTIHMLRDLIQLANDENLSAGFIFLDQEKAFDRVNHQFLFRVMKQYNIGDVFIHWLQQLYSNATTTVLVNGFHTPLISLARGVRQGCPISSLLYVLVIEILALQLRQNQNIVGFTVGGEKIVSLHYADDAVIVIKQNCCFKEVYKDLLDYEAATGAKINLAKSHGLWVGAWKGRTDSPLGYTWTNGNVYNLGVFFGNDDPALHTFNKIIPKIEKSITFWKQFYLSKFAKARIIEIFHASRLWYAAKFYCIPAALNTHLQRLFNTYINWPFQRHTVAEDELFKLRKDGGLKLINITFKSHASKIMWLTHLLTNSALQTHLQLVTRLLGTQRGHKSGLELFFVPHTYARRSLKVNTPFYKEAIVAFTALNLQQHVPTAEALGQQNVHYNRIFTDEHDKPLPITPRSSRDGHVRYKDFKREHFKHSMHDTYDKPMLAVFSKIAHLNHNPKEHAVITDLKGYLSFTALTEKLLYHELLFSLYHDHHSSPRWAGYFRDPLHWEKIWENCHNILSTESTKTAIWEQIHLNFFTQYCHNKGHGTSDTCPLCHTLPLNRHHLIISCPFTVQLFHDLEPYLNLIHPSAVTEYEMAFGLDGHTPSVLLRNWLTFTLRQCIGRQEMVAVNHPAANHALQVKTRLNSQIRKEVIHKYYYCQQFHHADFFAKHYQFTPHLVRITPSAIATANIFPL